MSAVRPLLEAARIRTLHYGGGITADEYDWATNTDIQNCSSTAAEFTAACANTDPVDFASFSANARAAGAQRMVTVNYGTGTPSLAASWVRQAERTPSQAVTDWEIGNESYGCWEANNELAGAPANYSGYVPNVRQSCPMSALGLNTGMALMASSYAANAQKFMMAMQAQDPKVRLGVPWAFDQSVRGAVVGDSSTWNDTVLSRDGKYISFVEAHWYPFGFGGVTGHGGNPSDQSVIQSVTKIPAEMAAIKSELAKYAPNAKVIVGETGVSYLATNVPCTPVGALFAAGDVLSWLAAGAESVDWWPLETDANLGSTCSSPDEAMFTNAGAPNSPYTGYLLASALAQPGAKLSALPQQGGVLRFQSVLPHGQAAVALINTSTSAPKTASAPLGGTVSTVTYSAANQNASNSKMVSGSTTASAIESGITLPAESIMILQGQALKPSGMTLGTPAPGNSYKVGAKVTVTGKLTLNGAPAPAGVPVKITRQASGSRAVAARLIARTGTRGTFTATDLPSAYGSYVYRASYLSSSYAPAASRVLVHVTGSKPSLTLAVPAKTVKPGTRVTVTATLGASHGLRQLVIYAQAKGGARKVIKRGDVNSKGQLTVVDPVTANTTFTVVFAGDAWYTPAFATASVNT
jgi:hypothetical protein